jgi:hypothetical protein
VAIATYGVDNAGLSWDGVALATGKNYPDALAGGVLQGQNGSVMVLTETNTLSPDTAAALTANAGSISSVVYLGGLGAISQTVRDQVEAILD